VGKFGWGRLVNNQYKLLVLDVDGTLLGKNRRISVEDKDALAKVRDSGVYVSLSTGRAVQSCLEIINQLSLDGYHIFSEGAVVGSPGQGGEIYAKPISKRVVMQMVEFAHRHEIDLDLYSATQYFTERETWSAVAHRHFFRIEPIMVDFTDLWERERIIKGGLVALTPSEADNVRGFCRQFSDSLYFSWVTTPAYPAVDFINVVATGVSKGKALEALTAYLGIAVSEVMAIGDGINDLPLFSKAGLAVAMGNAPDDVKAAADHVTLDIDHSGIAAAIEKFLL
jgi:hypothetical protein